MVGVSTLNRVKYAGLDFDTHFDDFQSQLQVRFAADYNDFALSALGIMLIDLQSFGLDTLSFYLDRRATDTYLQTARTRGAVSRLTRQLGYKMGAAVASSVDLTVAIRTPVAFQVPVPKGFQFQGPNNLIFETAKAVTFPANSGLANPLIIPCYEGETITETFVSDGTANQVFTLARVPDGKFAVAGSLIVTVNGAAFQESEFLTFDTTDQFEFAPNDEPPTIRFGDGVAGNIPVSGGVISVTYVASKGRGGLVLKNTITKVVSPLVVSFQTIQLSIDNPSPSVGGDDPESIEHAKVFAPLVFKSRHVAITRPDYEALAGSFSDPLFGRVAVAQAISSRSASTDLALLDLLTQINAAVSGPDDDVETEVAAALIKLDTLDLDVVGLNADFAEIASAATSGSGAITSARASSRQVKAKSLELAVNANSIISTTASGKTTTSNLSAPPAVSAVTSLAFASGAKTITRASGSWLADGVVPGMKVKISGSTLNNNTFTASTVTATVITCIGTDVLQDEAANVNATATVDVPGNDRLSTQTKNSLADLWDSASADASAVSTAATTISSAADGEITNMGVALDEFTEIGLTVASSGSLLLQASNRVASISTNSTGIRTHLNDIDTIVTDLTDEIGDLTAEVQEHVDQLLSADCKANLVTVPILTKDNTGFYAAPSIGLVQSLQSFLDGKKEVTQTVKVTSGISFLIPAVVEVRVGVLKGYALSATQKAVEAEIDSVLRDRKFGDSLFESELDEAVRKVDGVGFRNVQILGNLASDGISIEASRLDAQGNLIITIGEIVSKGTVEVNTEAILT